MNSGSHPVMHGSHCVPDRIPIISLGAVNINVSI